MVAQHYRWDFYGLSTDSKPDSSNPKVADGSTYYEADTSKLYVWYKDEWYEKQSTGGGGGGEAGAFKELTSADANYPADNPTDIAVWLLPNGIYHVSDSSLTIRLTSSAYFTYGSTFIATEIGSDAVNKYLYCFGDPESSGLTGCCGIQMYKVNKENGHQNFRGGFDLHKA